MDRVDRPDEGQRSGLHLSLSLILSSLFFLFVAPFFGCSQIFSYYCLFCFPCLMPAHTDQERQAPSAPVYIIFSYFCFCQLVFSSLDFVRIFSPRDAFLSRFLVRLPLIRLVRSCWTLALHRGRCFMYQIDQSSDNMESERLFIVNST